MHKGLRTTACSIALAVVLSGCKAPPSVLPPDVQPPPSPDLALAEAEEAFLNGDFGAAAKRFDQAVDRAASDKARGRARYWRGVCRLQLMQLSRAERDFEECLAEIEGTEWECRAREGLADCARKAGRFRVAVSRYEVLVSQAGPGPQRASLLMRLGQCRLELGQTTAGRDALAQAVRLDPTLEGEVRRLLPGTPTTAYAVQVGVFRERKSVQAIVAKLKAKGVSCRVASDTRQGQGLQRVLTGSFATKAEAKRHAQRVKAMGFEAIVVP